MMISRRPFIVHAPKFQLALAPSKRVEGIARDKDTGKPIAGLEIQAAVFDEHSLICDRGDRGQDRRRGPLPPRRPAQGRRPTGSS